MKRKKQNQYIKKNKINSYKLLTSFLFFFNSHWYSVCLIAIFLLSLFLRVYGFSHRWGLGSDDMRDVAIAKEALQRNELPVIGSFSSAGPFVFGPLFYWFIMISYILLPFTILAPWILLTLFGMIIVFSCIYLGYLIGGKRLSLIMGILAATSPQLVNRSIVLTQHSFVALSSLLLLINFILLWKKKKLLFSFLMGICLGLGISMHYQTINLFIFLPALLLVSPLRLKQRFFGIVLMLIGFLVPSLPLLLWDARQNFVNTRNIMDYFLIAQYRLYVPNSWKLFLLDFLPYYWSYVTGGYPFIGLLLFSITGFVMFMLIIFKKMLKAVFILSIIFLALVILNRYYRGERFAGYLLYLNPFVILFTSLSIETLLNSRKYFSVTQRNNSFFWITTIIGCIVLTLTLVGSLSQDARHVLKKENNIVDILNAKGYLLKKYPKNSFSLFDYKWENSDISYPLSAFLKESKHTDKSGTRIGVIRISSNKYKLKPLIRIRDAYIVDLGQRDSFWYGNKGWVNVNQEYIYDDLMQWTKTRKLKSSFSLFKFLSEKIVK